MITYLYEALTVFLSCHAFKVNLHSVDSNTKLSGGGHQYHFLPQRKFHGL